MSNSRFRSGVIALKERLLAAAGVPVTVSRGGVCLFEAVAVPAKTDFEAITDKGLKATVRVTDFILAARADWTPARGDRITHAGAVYVVRQIGAEWFRYDDAEEILIRVHAQRETPSE